MRVLSKAGRQAKRNNDVAERPTDQDSSVRTFTFIAGVNGFLAVVLGAFGAHGLKGRLTPDNIEVWDVGARYHLIHAVALLGVALLIGLLGDSKWLRCAGWLFTTGIILFSGSLYVLAVTGVGTVGAVTPFGGLCFLAGWICIAIAARK
jgi:uncharacterized membrane protein YgdD (TMEM256/DUF423 family)